VQKALGWGLVLSELSVEISIGFWAFGADDLVASLEDLWISVKELSCVNDWRVLAAFQKEIQGNIIQL
jgi:hypothetical protein